MKHLLPICSLLVISMASHAQDKLFPMKAGKVYYEIIDSSFHGRTKGQLYTLSKLWLFNQFNAADSILAIDNADEGVIAGRIEIPIKIRFEWMEVCTCSFAFAIFSKDGRFKAQLYNFQLNSDESPTPVPLEPYLSKPEFPNDRKNKLPLVEAQAYAFIRGFQLAMEGMYDWMDF